MKNLLLLVLLSLAYFHMVAQAIQFTDLNLKSYLVNEMCVDLNNDGIYDSNVDINNDNEVQYSEAEAVADLKIDDLYNEYYIKSIQEISFFTNLQRLTLFSNDSLEYISGLGLESLVHFWLDGSVYTLTHIDLSDLVNLVVLKIEGPMALDYLNIQNDSYPSEYFSLFYTENIQFACVDSIAAEYNEVAWHMAAGETPTINCEPTAIRIEKDKNSIVIFPNPARDLIEMQSVETIERLAFFDLQGQIQMVVGKGIHSIDVSGLKPGIYIIQIKTADNLVFRKLVKE